MINRTKRFNKKLWEENDKKGKEFATSILKKIYGNSIKIVEGVEYGVDLKLFNEDNKCLYHFAHHYIYKL